MKFIFDFDNLILPAILIVCIAVLVLSVFRIIEESNEWESFKQSHNCKVVAQIKGDVFNTFGTDGKGNMTVGVGSTPDKKGWLCDDGMTYYR